MMIPYEGTLWLRNFDSEGTKKYTHFEVRKHVIVIRVNDSNRKEDIRVCNKLINYITLHYFSFFSCFTIVPGTFFSVIFLYKLRFMDKCNNSLKYDVHACKLQ